MCPCKLAHLVHMTDPAHQSAFAFMWLMLPLGISGLGTLWHGCPVFSLLHATCLKLCWCLSWIWKASPASPRAVPFSLEITTYNKAVIFEVVPVIKSRQHLGRCVWYGSTSQLQLPAELHSWILAMAALLLQLREEEQGRSELRFLEIPWSGPTQSWGSVWT